MEPIESQSISIFQNGSLVFKDELMLSKSIMLSLDTDFSETWHPDTSLKDASLSIITVEHFLLASAAVACVSWRKMLASLPVWALWYRFWVIFSKWTSLENGERMHQRYSSLSIWVLFEASNELKLLSSSFLLSNYFAQVVLLFACVSEIQECNHSNESNWAVKLFSVVLFIVLHKVVQSFESVSKILKCDY